MKQSVCFLLSILIFNQFALSFSNEVPTVDDFETEQASAPSKSKIDVAKVKYIKPEPIGEYYYVETFESNVIGNRWIKSKAKKDDVDEAIAKYEGEWSIETSSDAVLEGDKGLVLKTKAKHHAISSKLSKPFLFTNNKPLVVQYEVKFQQPLECGGAYVKLVEDPKFNLESFYDKTSFSIMFGPDKCGTDNKFHFIIRFKNPRTGVFEEKHAKRVDILDAFFSDGRTHLYTLIVRPDNTYKMMIDMSEISSGSLLNDLNPPINPPKEIVDPSDQKPETWDEREKIPDPDATKPDDWDETEPKMIDDVNAKMPDGWLENEEPTIPDPEASKPEDWDDSIDKEWEAPRVDNPKCKSAPGCGKWKVPQINNPKYRGIWRAPLIANPNYQGKWEPRKIPNPDFFEDNNPFVSLRPFYAVGLELWSMTENIYFDNFIITDDESVADRFARDSWLLKKNLETINSNSEGFISNLLNEANEKPWLWAIYILVILIPIVLVTVFCFGGKSSSSSASSAEGKLVGDKKKTDAVSEDDVSSQDNEQPEEQDTAQGKADLEPKESEEDSYEKINPEETEEKNKAKKSPSKRKPRKD